MRETYHLVLPAIAQPPQLKSARGRPLQNTYVLPASEHDAVAESVERHAAGLRNARAALAAQGRE